MDVCNLGRFQSNTDKYLNTDLAGAHLVQLLSEDGQHDGIGT